jgi:hypothetical protein
LKDAKGRYRQLLSDLDKLLGRQPPPTQAEIEDMDPLSRDLYETVQQAGLDYQHEMAKLDSEQAVWTDKAEFILAKTRQDWISPPILEKFQEEMAKDLDKRDRQVVLSCRFAEEYFADVKVEESVVLDFAVCIYDYVFRPTVDQPKQVEKVLPPKAVTPYGGWHGLEDLFRNEPFAWAIVKKTLETEPSFRDDFKEVHSDVIYEIAMARSNVGHVRTAADYIWAKIQRKTGGHHMSQIGRAAIALQKAAGARSCWNVEKQFCPTCAEFIPLKRYDCCKREMYSPSDGPVMSSAFFTGADSTTFGNNTFVFSQTSTATPGGHYVRQASQKQQTVLADALEVFLDDAYIEYRAEVRAKSEPKAEERGIAVVPDPVDVEALTKRVERLGGKHKIDKVLRVGKWAAAGVAMGLFAVSQWPVWIAVALGAYVGISEAGGKIKANRERLLSEEKAHLKILQEAS